MLSNKEKEELIQDGLSETRREDFRQAKQSNALFQPLTSLDDYLKFLSAVQRVFSTLDPTFKKQSH